MNILMFGWEFPPHISGGLGTACYGIVNGLSSLGDVKVSFVVPKAHGNEHSVKNLQLISANNVSNSDRIDEAQKTGLLNFLEIDSPLMPYHTEESYLERFNVISTEKEIELSERIQDESKIHFSGKYGPNLFDEIANYALVAKTIARENQFNLIHAHDWLTFPAAISAKQVSGKPLILHIHSTDFDRSGGSVNPAIYQIEKQGMEAADHIITVSNLIKRRLVEQYLISAEKITTIYNAIDSDNDKIVPVSNQNKKEKIVTFLGRLTIQKGPEYFINVARMIIHRTKNVHFVMAGSGELRNRIIELCAKYRLGNRVHFTGFLNGSEVPEMLHRSDVFIMPSISEPFGIVPLEAMKANVPVIISNQSGVSELIKNVIKTDFWDIHAMADAVYSILKHPKLSQSLSTHGKTEVSQLNWEAAAEKIRQVYMKALTPLATSYE
jgi:glycosyltransferase involved in cell wall biosynthesis